MAKNKIEDLRDHLFAQLERLGDENLTGDKLAAELNRAKQVAAIAREVTASAKVEVDFINATGGKPEGRFFTRGTLPPPGEKKTIEGGK